MKLIQLARAVAVLGALCAPAVSFAEGVALQGFDFVQSVSNVRSGDAVGLVFVELTGAAPAGGALVTLDYAGGLTGPASVTIPAGQWNQDITVDAPLVAANTPVTIGASYLGARKTAQLEVKPAELSWLSVSPNPVVLGQPLTVTVSLRGKAPAGGAQVALSYQGADGVASVTVSPGQDSKTFRIEPTAATDPTPASVQATYGGVTKTQTYQVNAPGRVASLTASRSSYLSTRSVHLTLTLLQPATDTVSVRIFYSDPTLLADYSPGPTSIQLNAGEIAKELVLQLGRVADDANLTITAGTGPAAKSVTVQIRHHPRPVAIRAPSTILGGETKNVEVQMEVSAAEVEDPEIAMTSSNPSVLTVSRGYYDPSRLVWLSFGVTTTAVTAPTPVTLTAGGLTHTLYVVPPQTTSSGPAPVSHAEAVAAVLSQLSTSSSSLLGGGTVTATVTLASPPAAGGRGVKVRLSSSDPTLLAVPPEVLVPAGQTTATFTVRAASNLPASRSVVITATIPDGGMPKTANLVVEKSRAGGISPQCCVERQRPPSRAPSRARVGGLASSAAS